MANKIVQLVDKNSNNLYPVAGFVKDDAVSTGAISSQAVTTAKIANGAVTGVANDATAIGTAKLALDTVGTPNLRDQSVTSDKIDWTTTRLGTVTDIKDAVIAGGYRTPTAGIVSCVVVTSNTTTSNAYVGAGAGFVALAHNLGFGSVRTGGSCFVPANTSVYCGTDLGGTISSIVFNPITSA